MYYLIYTVRIKDFVKLNLVTCFWWLGFKLQPILTTGPAASKNEARFKSG